MLSRLKKRQPPPSYQEPQPSPAGRVDRYLNKRDDKRAQKEQRQELKELKEGRKEAYQDGARSSEGYIREWDRWSGLDKRALILSTQCDELLQKHIDYLLFHKNIEEDNKRQSDENKKKRTRLDAKNPTRWWSQYLPELRRVLRQTQEENERAGFENGGFCDSIEEFLKSNRTGLKDLKNLYKENAFRHIGRFLLHRDIILFLHQREREEIHRLQKREGEPNTEWRTLSFYPNLRSPLYEEMDKTLKGEIGDSDVLQLLQDDGRSYQLQGKVKMLSRAMSSIMKDLSNREDYSPEKSKYDDLLNHIVQNAEPMALGVLLRCDKNAMHDEALAVLEIEDVASLQPDQLYSLLFWRTYVDFLKKFYKEEGFERFLHTHKLANEEYLKPTLLTHIHHAVNEGHGAGLYVKENVYDYDGLLMSEVPTWTYTKNPEASATEEAIAPDEAVALEAREGEAVEPRGDALQEGDSAQVEGGA